MQSNPIRIGLVGAGRILPAHLRGYQLLHRAGVDTFRITAITSRTRRDAESFVERGAGPAPRPAVSGQPSDPLSVHDVFVSDFQRDVDMQVYDSLDDMLAADAVDALDISATLHVHHTAALNGIRRGKHCLVQKPLAISVAAGRAMVEAAQQRGVSLGVMENLRLATRRTSTATTDLEPHED
jgi:predicted dehydrogenase